MGASEEELTKFTQFVGLNNVSKETALTGNVLREADNVDLDRDGKIASRRGYSAPLVACENGHSLWSDKFLSFGLFADEHDLRMFNRNETAETLFTGLSPGLPVSYARINSEVFWSNGVQRGMVDVNLEVLDWACEHPAGQPELSALPGGSLNGQIQVCVTFLDRVGRESGATLAAVIDLAAPGGVLVSGIPQPQNPSDTPNVRIYATGPNGTALYAAATIPVGLTQYTLLATPTGRVIATQFLRPMPAGHIVRYGNGRQFVARDNIVFWSEALRYGLGHLGHNHLRLPKRIDMMEYVGDGTDGSGLYVASGERTFFFPGANPKDTRQQIANAYGAIPGSSCITPAAAWGIDSTTEIPAWMASDGNMIIGLPGGKVVTQKAAEAVTGVGERGASLFREADGLRQFLTTLRAVTMPRMGVVDKAIATVYRHDAA